MEGYSNFINATKIKDCDDNLICTNYPFATDGDSVYVKDVNQDNSSLGTFTGTIASLFDNINNEIIDTSATNPKTFTLEFFRPIRTTSIGIASKTGNFSNVKILLKTVSGDTRQTIDDSANNTKYTSNLYSIEPETFDTMTVEFHTADAVNIAGMTIPKDVPVVARLQALKPDGTVTNLDATTGGNLKISIEEYDDSANPVRSNLEGGGKVSVGTTAVEATFTGTTQSIIISADLDNTGMLYVGKSNVTNLGANAFCFLQPGEHVVLSYDDTTNAIYVVADAASQNFWKGALL